MRAKLKLKKIWCFTVVFMLPCYGSNQLIVAQNSKPVAKPGTQAEQKDRQRADLYFQEPAGARPGSKNTSAPKYTYKDRLPGKNRPAPKGRVYARVGVTIGRGRPATETELADIGIAKVPMCLEPRGKECLRWQNMAVERISDNTPVTHGTPIQMIIEYLAYQDTARRRQVSNRVAYLYVINRVQYMDGGTSPPRLIYPTRHTFGGDGRVLPGKTVMLPYPRHLWQIKRNKDAAQAFETYIIIVSPKPLKDSQGRELQGDNLGETSLPLDEQLVAKWVRLWGGGEIPSDLDQGLGQLFTQREQAASGDPARTSRDTVARDTDLTPGDPPPQIGFRKAIRPGDKMLITVKLPFKDTAAPAEPKP